jgi:hypothetical protein
MTAKSAETTTWPFFKPSCNTQACIPANKRTDLFHRMNNALSYELMFTSTQHDGKAIMLRTCYKVLSGSNLARNPTILIENFQCFSQSVWTNAGIVTTIRSLPPFRRQLQLIFHSLLCN